MRRQDGIHLARHTSAQQLAKVSSSPLLIKGQFITPLNKVRDLGVIIDSEPSMDAQTRNVARTV